ncbi:MAG: hypothetical protein HOP08_16235 [Cyclobacteriaceae bacterium]|nr:hypothetical protein [Cyclobacteriaceae bacterium]
MRKLEDIPKKDLFEAPEGYFDRLPGIIQTRVAESEKQSAWLPYFTTSLKYALPVLVIGIGAIFYWQQPEAQSAETLLTSIDTTQLVAYLDESDVSLDDLLESVPLDQIEADAIDQNPINKIIIDEEDLEDLSNEFGADYF